MNLFDTLFVLIIDRLIIMGCTCHVFLPKFINFNTIIIHIVFGLVYTMEYLYNDNSNTTRRHELSLLIILVKHVIPKMI